MIVLHMCLLFFFFNDTATTEIYTLSLHDALPIFLGIYGNGRRRGRVRRQHPYKKCIQIIDRKSTRLNSSHLVISYAVFCLKKKKKAQVASFTLDREVNWTR